MRNKPTDHYLVNCFLLMVPVLIWNTVLGSRLPEPFQPEMFWASIPTGIAFLENASRICIFGITLLMPLHLASPTQKRGLALYLFGLTLYFASWIVIIIYPQSAWSTSMIGFMAPAFTPLFWLSGMYENQKHSPKPEQRATGG